MIDLSFTPMSAEEMVALTKTHSFFSWSAQDAVNPIPMARAKGVYFWDANGKRYFDLNSQLMCVNIGHGDPRVIDAIKRQAEELTYAGPSMASRIRAEIGRELAALTPGDLKKFFFTLGGAEANESAIKMARAFTGRQKILVRYRSYHGATAGAITLTGDQRRWANEPGISGVIRTFDPYKYRSPLYQVGDSDEVFSRKCLEQYDVFLSHSSKDKPVVRELANRLKKDKLRVWFDERELKPGDSIPAKIEEGLEGSRVLVLCMSANAFGSDWAQLEAGTFRFRDPLNKERRFIPLRLDEAPIKGSLTQFLYLNWLPEDREQEYPKLLEACRPRTKSSVVEAQATREQVAEKTIQLDYKAKIRTYMCSARMESSPSLVPMTKP